MGKELSGQGLLFPLEPSFSLSRVSAREVRCSSVLHKLNYGSSTEYTANFYRGCAHGCVYCYAPSLVHDERRWGDYVDVKVNAPAVLDRELRDLQKDIIFISSASDPYQPAEAKYKITRNALKVIRKHDFPILLLTRSPLVLRDLDILTALPWVRVGFSISTASDHFYEPGVPSLEMRLEALRKLNAAGIKTWVSLAPIIPSVITENLDWLFSELKRANISGISFGLLRFIGYEASRVMFEERSGITSAEALAGSSKVMEKVHELAEKYKLDTSCSSLRWQNQEDPKDLKLFL
jgi:DNA repair photolyase